MIESGDFSEFGSSSSQEAASIRRLFDDTTYRDDLFCNDDDSSPESSDSDTEESGVLKRTLMFQDLSQGQSLYESFSLSRKKQIRSRECPNDLCLQDKKVPVVEENARKRFDADDEVSKKIESRLWFFNAVSKTNCCDCYKQGHANKSLKEDILSCPEYKRIKETEEYTDFIKESIYTSVLKGNVRKNEEYLVDYLETIDENDEEYPVDTLEVDAGTLIVKDEKVPIDEVSFEPGLANTEPSKRFRRLRNFFAKVFCCCVSPSKEDE